MEGRQVSQVNVTCPEARREASNKVLDEYIDSTALGRESLECFGKAMLELKDALGWTTKYPFSAASVPDWQSGVRPHLQRLDEAAQQLIKGLTEGLKQFKAFCSQEIERLRDLLMNNELCSEKMFQLIFDNVCKPILLSFDTKITEEPPGLLESWRNKQGQMNLATESIVLLLRDAGELWDQHCQRQESGRQKILDKLQDKRQNRRKCTEAKERRLAQVIEKSRQETNRECLLENMERIGRILDDIKMSYVNEHENETKFLQENYSTLITHDLSSLNALSRIFLQNHQMKSLQEDTFNYNTYNTKLIELTQEGVLFIKLQHERLSNDIVQFLAHESDNFVRRNGEEWITEQLSGLHKEFDDIFESQRLRYDAIRSEVEVVRIAEIEQHHKLIETQRKIASTLSANLNNELEATILKEFQIFKDLSFYIQTLKEKGLHAFSVLSVERTIQEVEAGYTECKDSVRDLISEYQTLMMAQVQKIKEENHHFLQSTKQFTKGGNFTPAEATTIKNVTQGLELDMESQGRRNVLSLKQRSRECCTEAIAHVKMCLQDLQLHLEGLKFTKDISSLIRKTQGQLRKHVLTLKYGGAVLKEQTSELIENSTFDFKDKWKCVMETIVTRKQLLLSEGESGEVHEEMIRPDMKALVYFKQQDNSFLPLVYCQLKESLQTIEMITVEFHKKKTKEDIMNPTSLKEVHNFMSALTSKYKLYQNQCIEIWISELTDFLEIIQGLRSTYATFSEKLLQDLYESFHMSFSSKKKLLQSELIILRANYQQFQVETMARLNPIQGCAKNQDILSTLCVKFQKTSEHLSKKVENLIDSYMLQAQRYLDEYQEELQKQKNIIKKSLEKLNGKELKDNLLQTVQCEIEYLSKFYSLPIQTKTNIAYVTNGADNNFVNDRTFSITPSCDGDICPHNFQQSFMRLLITVHNFHESLKKDFIGKYSTPASLEDIIQRNYQEARALVQSETHEVKHLYAQYKDMAEELRMKWKITLESVQHLYASPILSSS